MNLERKVILNGWDTLTGGTNVLQGLMPVDVAKIVFAAYAKDIDELFGKIFHMIDPSSGRFMVYDTDNARRWFALEVSQAESILYEN